MTNVRVSAVVVTWNSVNDIDKCLTSLFAQTFGLTQIIVVDNASQDGTVEYVQTRYSNVKLISLDYNAGFARGNNLGIAAAAECDWILLLNPDACIEPDWIEKLLDFASHRMDIGALGGVLWRSGDGLPDKTIIDSLGIEIYKSRRVRDFGTSEEKEFLPDRPNAVFGICAAAALYNCKMLKEISIDDEIFPERFFCYYEDADLAWRAWRRGWSAWIVPAVSGYHRRGGSPVGSRFSRFLTHRNRLWLIIRNDNPHCFLLSIPEIFLHELYMLARLLRYPYLIKAVIQSLTGIKKSLAERRKFLELPHSTVPFKPGVGFSRKEKALAMKPKAKKYS